MPAKKIEIAAEVMPKKVFVWGIDWPGWCRSGRDLDAALQALADAAPRYTSVARAADLSFPNVGLTNLDLVASVPGSSGTLFGIPSIIIEHDRGPVSAAQSKRLAALVEAAWNTFDAVAAKAPFELRKGPRGGGRDLGKMITHVVESDQAYAREVGVKSRGFGPEDQEARDSMRQEMLSLLRKPSDGSPMAGRKWPLRYAARYIAWHALDHAWEIEDRSEPS